MDKEKVVSEIDKALRIGSVVKSFYCQKPKQLKKMPKCEWQCGLCATFEGKRQ